MILYVVRNSIASWLGNIHAWLMCCLFVCLQCAMAQPAKYQQMMKVILVGDSGTGKSCLLHRFVEDSFSEEQTQTIGVEFGAKSVQVLGQSIKLQIWDTAGQERYRSVTRSYYRGAVGCLLVYDVTCRASYEHVAEWLSDVRQLAGKEVVIMLVGNKSDLASQQGERRAVASNEAAIFAQQNGLLHYETSAASGELVNDAFMKVVKEAYSKGNPQVGKNSRDDDDLEESNEPANEDPEDNTVSLRGQSSDTSSKKCRC